MSRSDINPYRYLITQYSPTALVVQSEKFGRQTWVQVHRGSRKPHVCQICANTVLEGSLVFRPPLNSRNHTQRICASCGKGNYEIGATEQREQIRTLTERCKMLELAIYLTVVTEDNEARKRIAREAFRGNDEYLDKLFLYQAGASDEDPSVR